MGYLRSRDRAAVPTRALGVMPRSPERHDGEAQLRIAGHHIPGTLRERLLVGEQAHLCFTTVTMNVTSIADDTQRPQIGMGQRKPEGWSSPRAS
jgi:hypothetical protein